MKDYLNQSGLTDKEKADYLSKSETIRNLEGQLEALFDKNGHVTDQAKADALEKELNGLYDVIDALDTKVEAEQIKANKNLTDKEKDTLITTLLFLDKTCLIAQNTIQ
ncbi:hypothetical protein [Streptococcus sp. 20-1249]|uniref:hypothetical protein n=1 Tax=Streptococcus hepaticus TaxID=3349163 RepID=UPI00374A6BB8